MSSISSSHKATGSYKHRRVLAIFVLAMGVLLACVCVRSYSNAVHQWKVETRQKSQKLTPSLEQRLTQDVHVDCALKSQPRDGLVDFDRQAGLIFRGVGVW